MADRTAQRAVPTFLIAACILLVACGNDIDTAAQAPAESTAPSNDTEVTVVSTDGRLTLTVPVGAMPAGTEISIDEAVEARPPQLDGFDVLGAVYRLEPDGLEFATPARAVLRIDRPADWDAGMPLLLPGLISGGELGPVEASYFELDDAELRATVDIAHFSELVLYNGAIVATMSPQEYSGPEGEFEVAVTVNGLQETLASGYFDREHRDRFDFTATGGVKIITKPDLSRDFAVRLKCSAPGGTFSYRIHLREAAVEFIRAKVDDPAFERENKDFGFVILLLGVGGIEAFESRNVYGHLTGQAACAGQQTDEEQSDPNADEPADAIATGGEPVDETIEVPDQVAAPWTVEVTDHGDCAWPRPPSSNGEAYPWPHRKRTNDRFFERGPGWALLLGTTHSPFLQFNLEGELVTGIEPRGDDQLPTWEVISVVRERDTVTIHVVETRYDDGVPCSQEMTYVYSFPDGLGILDWMADVPAGDISNLELLDGTANYTDGVASIDGQIAGDGDIWIVVFMECSGDDITYAIEPVHRDADGTFSVETDLPGCVVVNMFLVANGNVIASATVSD